MAQRSRTDAEAFGRQFAAASGDSQGGKDQFSLALFQIVIQTDLTDDDGRLGAQVTQTQAVAPG